MHFAGTRRYTLRRELGVGAVGRVYEAWDTQRRREIALKTLVTLSPRALYRFKSEFRALSGIRHENLATLHELAVEGDTWFIVMELVRGFDFSRWVRGEQVEFEAGNTTFLSADGITEEILDGPSVPQTEAAPPPDPDRVREAIVQLLGAIDALHAHGKLHRDVKPSNVVVTPEGRVVLLDFGLVYDTDRAASELSRVDRVVGTAAFMSPEQALGDPPTTAGDLYSVGVMLFHALTGRLPFEGNMLEMLSAKQVRDAPGVGSLLEDLPLDLVTLCDALLQREPEQRPTARQALRSLGAVGVAPVRSTAALVGREAERQQIEESWIRARNGRGCLVSVTGAAGVGKTALVKHVLGGLKRYEDVWILRGRCHERETVPFKAIDALLDSLRRKLTRLPPEQAEAMERLSLGPLVTLFPILREVLGDPDVDASLTGEALRNAATEAGARLLRMLSRIRPLVIFLDDLQWGDAASGRLLLQWLGALSHSRCLVVLAGREGGPMLDTMRDDKRWVRIEHDSLILGLLDEDPTRLLVQTQVDDGEVVQWVVRESGGHPGLALDLCHAWQDEPFDLTSMRFEDLLNRRLDRLTRDEQRVLVGTALTGRPTPAFVLARAMEVDDVEACLANLADQRLVRCRRIGPVTLVELVHERLTATVLGRERPEAQARMHLALAGELDRAGWGDADALLEHYVAAGKHDRVGPLAMKAAGQAVDDLAYDTAVQLYRTAVAFVPPTERVIAQSALAEALALAGRGIEATEAFIELAGSHQGVQRISYLRRAAEQALYTGHIERGVQLFEDVLEALDLPSVMDEVPTGLASTAARWMSGLMSALGRPGAVDEHRIREQVDASFAVSVAFQLLDPVRAARFHARALQLSARVGDDYRKVRSRCLGLAIHAATSSDWDRWRRESQHLREAVGGLHSPYVQGLLGAAEGLSAYLDGTYRSGMRVLTTAERNLRHVSAPFELTVARVFRVRCLIYSGELTAARQLRDAYVEEGLDRGNELLVRCLRGDVMALLDLAVDDPDSVKRHVVDIIENWSGGRWPFQRMFVFRAEALRLLYLGRYGAAFEVTERMREQMARGVDNRVMLLHYGALRARVCAVTGRGTEAENWVSRVRGIEHRLAKPFAAWLRGVCCVASGRSARAALTEAEMGFDRADLGLYLHAIRRARAVLEGDERGKAAAEGWMRHQGVERPEAMTQVFVPGLSSH